MKLYLAGRYSRKLELQKYAQRLKELGFTITSRWLDEPENPNVKMSEVPISRLMDIARYDIEDIDKANALVFFAEDPEFLGVRGGRHVEFGYALALNKPIYVVGPFENVFHYLAGVQHVDSFDAFVAAIKPVQPLSPAQGMGVTPK